MTESHTLRKPQKHRKYRCRMCKTGVNSASELVKHHQTVHGIVYCAVCNKHSTTQSHWLAMNTHTRRNCSSVQSMMKVLTFQVSSKTHNITHQHQAKHLCAFPKCGRIFKNKLDLTRHANTHTAKPMKCPDCEYSSWDKRNYESHRLKYSKIERYFCDVCGKGLHI